MMQLDRVEISGCKSMIFIAYESSYGSMRPERGVLADPTRRYVCLSE
jgi:hypothetical protein